MCAPCSREHDAMRAMVAGLRGMPPLQVPAGFTDRLMQRYQQEKDAAVDMAATYPVTSAQPTEASAAAVRQAWMPRPVQPRWAPSRPLYALAAAVIAVVFFGGLFTGQSMKGGSARADLMSMPLSDLATQVFPVKMDMDGKREGVPGQWHEARLKMTAQRPLDGGEVALHVPPGVQINVENDTQNYHGMSLVQIGSRPRMLQLVTMPCAVPTPGEWQRQIRWRANESGQFNAWVEVRCSGLYKRQPIQFVAGP